MFTTSMARSFDLEAPNQYMRCGLFVARKVMATLLYQSSDERRAVPVVDSGRDPDTSALAEALLRSHRESVTLAARRSTVQVHLVVCFNVHYSLRGAGMADIGGRDDKYVQITSFASRLVAHTTLQTEIARGPSHVYDFVDGIVVVGKSCDAFRVDEDVGQRLRKFIVQLLYRCLSCVINHCVALLAQSRSRRV